MNVDDFDFELPEALIAQAPPAERTGGRLLYLDASGRYQDSVIADLPRHLKEGDLLVFNDTRVIPARCHGIKDTGGRIEVFLERITGINTAQVQLGSNKKIRPGLAFTIGDVRGEVLGGEDGFFEVQFEGNALDVFENHGHVPLPPYVKRADSPKDRERYQTILATRPGAVAAPTAGLHFDNSLLELLDKRGIGHVTLTLHVGAGTFQPVRVDKVEDHQMHSERYHVPESVTVAVEQTRRRGGRVVAVGTTSARTLESVSDESGIPQPGSGETRIFIYPGYRFRCVDMLMTNFHLPRSSLMMMVSAFSGRAAILNAYRHAVDDQYRFFSYGDAMLLERAA